MEFFEVSLGPNGFRVEGIPDGAKVIALEGHLAQRLSDLALHHMDLGFADECLQAINKTPMQEWVIRQALWRSAVVHFVKCFQSNGARPSTLDAGNVYKGDVEGLRVFQDFMDLRNKHVVHDENGYLQSLPGAVLNSDGKAYRVEKIVSFNAVADTLGEGQWSNLKLLIEKAKQWVTNSYDEIAVLLTTQLESESPETLMRRPEMEYCKPKDADMGQTRRQHR